MFKFGKMFIEEIRKAGAKPVIYMTWALKSKPEEFASVIANCRDIGKEAGAAVVPVGAAWQKIVKDHPEVDLYAADGKHPRLERIPGGMHVLRILLRQSSGLTSEFTLADPHADAKPHEYKIPAETAAELQKAADEALKAQK